MVWYRTSHVLFPMLSQELELFNTNVKLLARMQIHTRRLITTNRSQVSICHKNFGVGLGMVDPVKIFLSSRLITMPNLVAVCHNVWAYVRGPPKFGGSEALLPWDRHRA